MKRIQRLEDDNSTHIFMLYILRVFDNPSVLESDISWIESIELMRREKRRVGTSVMTMVYVLLGLALSAIISYLSTNLSALLTQP